MGQVGPRQWSRGGCFRVKRRSPLIDRRVGDLLDAALYRRDSEIVHQPEDARRQAFGDLKDMSQR